MTGLGLRIGGWATFGITYFTAFMAGVSIGGAGGDAWSLMIPGIGPMIVGIQLAQDNEMLAGLTTLAIIWSAAEIAGLAMIIAGYSRRARIRRQSMRQVAILPAGPADGPGLTVAARF